MQFLKKGSTRQKPILLLQAFLREGGYLTVIDGKFGSGTERAIKHYQRDNSLVVDGIVGEKSWTRLYQQFPDLLSRIVSKYLSESDITETANDHDLDVALLKSVNEVESSGAGFIVDRPKILFEGHVFWKELKKQDIDPKKFKNDHPNIVYSKWTHSHYLGGELEYLRLEEAISINREAALKSASWGAFQIMGFNAESIGFSSVESFVKSMKLHEREHLKAVVAFLEKNNLMDKLRAKNWRAFARGYNGPSYEKNNYHIKLERAYARYKDMEI